MFISFGPWLASVVVAAAADFYAAVVATAAISLLGEGKHPPKKSVVLF